ncbi:unnamed protein product [Blepharisma stoltei]|uniref:Uncharacterized protein n=1 Tax=Blepharisma stoltei TaxID=1481888 RepID=A0AAU9KET7_9CILI|nr:unnamed protein product [Blepharisma stoltei]
MTCPCPGLRISPRRALKHKCFSKYFPRKKPFNQSISMFECKSSRKDLITLSASLEILQAKTIVLKTNFMPMKKVDELRRKLMKLI